MTDLNELKFKKIEFQVKFVLSAIIILCGAFMNLTVLVVNGGMMPVKIAPEYEGFSFESRNHFTYVHDYEVRAPLFTDRIYFMNWILSIGDVVMALASALTLYNFIFMYKYVLKIKKAKKLNEKFIYENRHMNE